LSLDAAPRVDAIGFGLAEKSPLTDGRVDLAYQVSMDEFRGVRRLSLKVKDLKSSS
jgi:single-stranded-DNA-specific exonuclease